MGGRVKVKKMWNEEENTHEHYNQQLITFNMKFTEELEIESFPFDVQDLSVVLKEKYNARDIVHTAPNDNVFTTYIKFDKTWDSMTDWDILGIDASVITIPYQSHYVGQSYELVVLRVQVARKWKGIVYRLIMWLLFLGIMSWSTFGVDSENIGERLSYAVTMALTVVAFQFIISDNLPQVSYMTLLDIMEKDYLRTLQRLMIIALSLH